MPIINRVSRLFTADLNAVLDRIEEPEVLLRQALRDMEEEILASEHRVTTLRRDHDQWLSRAAEAVRKLADLDDQLDVCFASNEDALARSLIRRKLEAERAAQHIGERSDAIAVSLAEAKSGLTEQVEALAGLREKAELMTDAPATGEPNPIGNSHPIGDDEVDVAFLREKQLREKQLREKQRRSGS